MRTRFIYNPTAGHVRHHPDLPAVLRNFAKRTGMEAEIVPTQYPGHARLLSADAASRGIPIVVAIGGDGTVNEIASGLLGTATRVGIIPMGSGNGLARELGIPLKRDAALSVIAQHQVRRIDSGMINNHAFFCTTGTGFDSHVVEQFNRRTKRGLSAYLQEGLRAWFSYSPKHYEISVDGRHAFSGRLLLLCTANASQFGNNARIAPSARLDDGMLDMTLVPPMRSPEAMLTVFRLFTGRLSKSSRIRFLRGQEFTVSCNEKGQFHVDGEVRSFDRTLSLGVVPGSLHVATPGTQKR